MHGFFIGFQYGRILYIVFLLKLILSIGNPYPMAYRPPMDGTLAALLDRTTPPPTPL